MRVLALDYGTARDRLRDLRPERHAGDAAAGDRAARARGSVAELVAEHEVERVVVGLPLHLSGEEGAQAALTRDLLRANSRRCSTCRSRPTTSG